MTVVVIKKKPGIKKLVTFVVRVSSTSTANKIVGCAGITKFTFNVCAIAIKKVGGMPRLNTIGTTIDAVAD